MIKLNRLDACRAQIQLTARGEIPYMLGVGLPKHGRIPSLWTPLAYFGVSRDGSVRELSYRDKDNHRVWRKSPLYNGEPTENLFRVLANFAAQRDWHWSVVARSGDYKVVFTIPDNDAPRFFKAREGKAGTKIFHSVAAHHRTLKSGKTTTVRTHYAGRRQFQWSGYDISIQIPGKHRASLNDYTDEIRAER